MSSLATLQEELSRIWREVLDKPSIGLDDDFFAIGGDSLDAVAVMMNVRATLHQVAPISLLYEAPTVRELATKLLDPFPETKPRFVELSGNADNRHPFFCVHGVGGEVTTLAALGRHLSAQHRLVGIAAPVDLPEAQPSIEALAAQYVAQIRVRQPTGPYLLGGYSLGGSIAYEMACQLLHQGENVSFVAIIDHCPPPIRFERIRFTPTVIARMVANAPGWGSGLIKKPSRLRQIGGRFLDKLIGRRTNDTRRAFGTAQLPQAFRSMIEQNYRALRRYRPTPYPGSLTLFRARTQGWFAAHGPSLGWQRFVANLEVVHLPGDHETLIQEPNVVSLAREIGRRLDHALSTTKSKTIQEACQQLA